MSSPGNDREVLERVLRERDELRCRAGGHAGLDHGSLLQRDRSLRRRMATGTDKGGLHSTR